MKSKGRFRLLSVMAAVLLMCGLAITSVMLRPAGTTYAASYCQVTYTVTNQWTGGFGANITIQNTSASAWTNWTLVFAFPVSGQSVSQGWNGTFAQSSQTVTVTNMSWNGAVAVNGTVTPGFNGAWTTSNPVPTSFTVNGNVCNGSTGTTPTPGTTPTVGGTTPTPTVGTTPTPGTHVDNPYAGAKGYVNPEWSAKAKADGGSAIANVSTGVWLDRIAAIAPTDGTMGLRAHLDAALSQAGGSPLTVQFVIYDLPNRDCSALASNGELLVAQDGMNKYKTLYIDPIAAIMADSKYSSLRIVTVIEIDSLPNLITNADMPLCAEAKSSGAYVQGVQYALNKLHAISNVYTYIDAAHSGWLGWDTNFGPAVDLWKSTVQGTTAGFASVDGFITDTANYTPVTEPYLPNSSLTINGNPIRSADFYQWNPYFDEASFGSALYTKLVAAGFSSNVGILIDTSRNGWGGSARPTNVSTSTDLNTYVNESRIDKRPGRGDWCNQSGAGLGIRPVASPATHFDAYVWIKPPGESDGSSKLIPNDQGKGFDQMCDPTYGGNPRNNNQPSGALADSPISGAWFSAQFHQLMQNAYPAL
jgi:cellulose 1,4-beta-cellobiosidase